MDRPRRHHPLRRRAHGPHRSRLILRGLLTEKQINRSMRVGDLWLRHHEATRPAASAATAAATRQMEDIARQRAEEDAEEARCGGARSPSRRGGGPPPARGHRLLGVGFQGPRRSAIPGRALLERNLPMLSTPADVAKAMGLSISELRFLCFHAGGGGSRTHLLPGAQALGGHAVAPSPQPRLARRRRGCCTRCWRSSPPRSRARLHQGSIDGDLRHPARRARRGGQPRSSDFFPTISFTRARRVPADRIFAGRGHDLRAACTGRRDRSSSSTAAVTTPPSAARVPHRACTSSLSNQVARKLDRRLAGWRRSTDTRTRATRTTSPSPATTSPRPSSGYCSRAAGAWSTDEGLRSARRRAACSARPGAGR